MLLSEGVSLERVRERGVP